MKAWAPLLVAFSILPYLLAAEPSQAIVTYSMLTKCFDTLPPIGESFQIKGTITSKVQAVRVESFGYRNMAPSSLKKAVDASSYYDALNLERGKAGSDMIYSSLAWERPDSSQPDQTILFSVNHPRLYWGREYFFAFTYYYEFDSDAVKAFLKNQFLDALDEFALEFEKNNTLNGEDLKKRLTGIEGKVKAAYSNIIIDRATRQPVDIKAIFNEEEFEKLIVKNLATIENAANIQKAELKWAKNKDIVLVDLPKKVQALITTITSATSEEKWKAAISELKSLLRKEEGSNANDFYARVDQYKDFRRTDGSANDYEALNAIQGEISAAIADIVAKKASESYDDLSAALGSLGTNFEEQSNIGKAFSELVAACSIHTLLFGKGEALTSTNAILDNFLAQGLSNKVFVGDSSLSIASVQPYFQTLDKRYPNIISLDGGLAYIEDFKELIPCVGLNFKLFMHLFGIRDANDPYDVIPELSFVVGLGLTPPTDLDPDYHGAFGSGDQSLLLGLGLRLPFITTSLRFQVGYALYRQADANPLVKDLTTKDSLYFGLSLNWDALDYAAKLFNGRPSLNLGG
jgi:hypothetical protein